MDKKSVFAGLALLAFAMLLQAKAAVADEVSHVNNRQSEQRMMVKNQLYESECGACHFAYQAYWLPARSWRKIMGSLDMHFGENAELSLPAKEEITTYLVAESADHQASRRAAKILRRLNQADTPLRISALPYIRGKHAGIPERFIAGNARVGSLANCIACHSQAARGDFEEERVAIPGYGRWED